MAITKIQRQGQQSPSCEDIAALVGKNINRMTISGKEITIEGESLTDDEKTAILNEIKKRGF